MTRSSTKPLAGQVAIITGAGQPVSLGRSYAQALGAAGAKLVINDNGSTTDGSGGDDGLAEIAARELRDDGFEAVADASSVASADGARAIVETAIRQFGQVDILVNNAGNQRFARIYDATDEDFDSLVAVHLRGTFNMVRAVSRPMMDRRSGVIINTGSTGGLGFYGNSIYAAVKEGVVGFTRSIARDLGPYGIRCNSIRPGAISRMRADPLAAELAREAELTHGFPCAWNQFVLRDMVQSTEDTATVDLDPRHVANALVWLCSDAAAMFNGRSFRMAGSEFALLSDPEYERAFYRAGGWDYESLQDPQVCSPLVSGVINRFAGSQCSET